MKVYISKTWCNFLWMIFVAFELLRSAHIPLLLDKNKS